MREIPFHLATAVFALFFACQSCGSESVYFPPNSGTSGAADSGSSGTAGMDGQPVAGSNGGTAGGGGSTDGGSAGGGGGQGCPSGLQCTALAEGVVCVEPATGLPPLCDGQGNCSSGECTSVGQQRYCVTTCGPDPVADCPGGSSCLAPAGVFICTPDDTGLPPACSSQTDCALGACLPYQGASYCLQPCEFPVVGRCPDGMACLYLRGNFICAQPSTGAPDICDASGNCAEGDCVRFESETYCVQACEPSVVEQCPAEATCRTVVDAFMCTLDVTGEPPACGAGQTCAWGECITTEQGDYCLEYCRTPLIEVFGLVADIDQAPLAGVEVCLLDDARISCATSGVDGSFRLSGLPDQDYYLITLKKSGYQSVLRASRPFEVLSTTVLYSDERAGALFSAAVARYPETATGSIGFSAATLNAQSQVVPVQGYSVSLTPAPAAAVGPVYADESQALDPTLQSSSSAGWGALYNVTPGDYQLTYTHASLDCSPPLQVKVAAGFLSSSYVAQCR